MVVTVVQPDRPGLRASPGSRAQVVRLGQQSTVLLTPGQTVWQPTAEQDSPMVVASPLQGRLAMGKDRLVRTVRQLVRPVPTMAT